MFLLAASGSAVLTFHILPLHWRGQYREGDSELALMYPYSEEFQSGIRRLLPLITVSAWCGTYTAIGICAEVVFGVSDDVLKFVYVPVVCVVFVILILAHLIIYRNIPKFLVAPIYRADLGVVEVRRMKGTLWKGRVRSFVVLVGVLTVLVGVAFITEAF
ncbi:hypothetical protein AB0B28_02575 [Glycomyces sp. NPDC046736]|uniref:hypothetical protein n=1 Tax=Glycomyces sp. NPDC046736 TaxID=3155615 RepID=UPI0034003D7A